MSDVLLRGLNRRLRQVTRHQLTHTVKIDPVTTFLVLSDILTCSTTFLFFWGGGLVW